MKVNEFNIGDLVRINMGNHHYLSGLKGTVTRVRHDAHVCATFYEVKFLEPPIGIDGMFLYSEEFPFSMIEALLESSLSDLDLRSHESIRRSLSLPPGPPRANSSAQTVPECRCERLIWGHDDGCEYVRRKRH